MRERSILRCFYPKKIYNAGLSINVYQKSLSKNKKHLNLYDSGVFFDWHALRDSNPRLTGSKPVTLSS
jgi:hypothetical protein